MNIFSRLFNVAKEKAFSGTSFTSFLSGGVDRGNLMSNNKNWVFVAVDRISSSMSGIRFKVMKTVKDDDDQEVFTGPLYDFISRPHPNLTWRDFVYLNTAYKELTGNSFWKVDEDKKTLIPLIPTKVTPIVDRETNQLIGYKYTIGTKTETIIPEFMLHDKYPSPNNPFWGQGPLERIADWVDTDAYASEFNRLFFINGASFGGVLETDVESKERIELIKAGLKRDHVGVKNSHKWAVLPKNTKFKEVTQSMKDMQFTELDATYRDKILAAFGVPKTLAGLTTEVNRASAEASEYIFATYTLKPKVDRFVDFLNHFVVPLFDKTNQFYIDYDEFVPENKEIKILENDSALKGQQYMTINEVRAGRGLRPVTGGDTIYGNPMQIEIGQPEKKEVKAVPDPIGAFVEKAVNSINVKQFDSDKKAHDEFVARVDEYEKQITGKVKDFNLKQKNEVIQKLSRITKAVAKGDLFDFDEQVGILVDFVSPLLRGLFTEQILQEYLEQGFEGSVDLSSLNVSKVIEKASKRLAKTYNRTTATMLKTQLNQGIQEGESLDQLTKRVESIYEFSDNYRAGVVAQTESFYVANEASREAYIQSGVVKTIRWYTADSDACQYCAPLDGVVIDVDETFFEKGEAYTGSAGGTLNLDYRTIDVPPLHPHCRCFIRPEEISISELAVSEPEDTFIAEVKEILNG